MDNLGFNLIGYGCTTCIGNSGELDEDVAKAITDNGNFILTNLSQLSNFSCSNVLQKIKSHSLGMPLSDIIAAAVLSGNRNFEGRIHALVRANYLASPPLVVAYALAGTVSSDLPV